MADRFAWRPQERQAIALDAAGVLGYLLHGDPVKEPVAPLIGYGGAAGGGKTDTMLALGRIINDAFPGSAVTYFRRTYPELEGSDGPINRSMQMFHDQEGKYHGNKHVWKWDNGSQFYFRHMATIKDMYKYQGHQLHVILVDEATHFIWEMIDYVITRNRNNIPGLSSFAFFGSNPGNVGHAWFMQLFDVNDNSGGSQGPHQSVKITSNPNGTTERVMFIPARLEDNQILMSADPDYERKLRNRNPELAEALRWGNWQIFAGQAFREWRQEKHVVEAFDIPDTWPRWMGIDWGYGKPWAALWLTMNPDTDRIYVYRELYESGLSDIKQAKMIKAYSGSENILVRYADPSMFNEKTGDVDTSDKTYSKEGVYLKRGDNNRIQGKRKVHNLLQQILPDGYPRLQVLETCVNLRRTLPALNVSILRPEDIDTLAEDHLYDALRYAVTFIPMPVFQENEEEKQMMSDLMNRVGELL